MRTLLGCLWILLVAAPAAAQLEASVSQRLAAIVNPEGAEHLVAAGVRARLGSPDELIFTGAHAEAGVINYTSPVDSMTGGYLEVSPIAVLVLRAELLQISMWPLGMPGAAYHPMQGYGQSLRGDVLDPARGEAATGWSFAVNGVLQGAVPIGAAQLLLWNQTTFTLQSLGESPYYYTPRYDMILAEREWLLGDHAMLLVEAGEGDVRLRIGAYDHLAYNLESGVLINQVGAIVAAVFTDPTPGVAEVMPFARAGVFTDHDRRAGTPTFLLGVTARYSIR